MPYEILFVIVICILLVILYISISESSNCRRMLIKNLDKKYISIIKAYDYIDGVVRSKKEVVAAAEWLLDNLYLIEKEYKDIKHNIPKDFYKNLPLIKKGNRKGLPRVYSIAKDIISKSDGKLEETTIENYIIEFQRDTGLTSGELWALPMMLRIGLIESIESTVSEMIFAQKEKNKADSVAETLVQSIERGNLRLEISKLNEEISFFTSPFTERFLKALRDNSVDNTDIYNWLDERLEFQDSSCDKMISIEHQKQAAFQLSMKNCISGIREVESLNWKNSFEKLSLIEQILLKDPSNIYPNMDFESKDFYRHSVENISRKMHISEVYLSKKAVECAQNNKIEQNGLNNHVGYYLVDEGVDILRDKLKLKNKSFLLKWIEAHKVNLYILTIVIGTLLLVGAAIQLSYSKDHSFLLWKYIIAFFVMLIPSSEIIVAIFNWSINKMAVPRFIPKLEFKDGIPEEYRTIVVVPTLLNNKERANDIISQIEVSFLGNSDSNLYFAILGDFYDSKEEKLAEDEVIISTVLKKIKNLNQKYKNDPLDKDIFYFFNRDRMYNPKEKIWMGWERKRGKLMEFNALIRGHKDTSYSTISGDLSNIANIRYVITLDADTELPRDTAKKLIGAMSHPLNKAYISEDKKTIARGYGIMQPKVSIGTLSGNKTIFSKIYSGDTGIDIYSKAVSDVYGDLFAEGIFTGKGIYDIDIFSCMLEGEIRENSVLSHDMLEGCFARVGLVTDIELIDGYPAYYNSYSMRLHRWVRGDWQLLPWIFKKHNSINKLSKWKMIDNLRRSLIAPSIIILIILSFIVLPNGIDKWLTISLLSIVIPILFNVSDEVMTPIRSISFSGRVHKVKSIFEQVFLHFCFLPYQAYLMLDAIIRTIYRISISKRHLLEWQTSSDTERIVQKTRVSFIKTMWPGSALAVLILNLAFFEDLSTGIFLVPYCLLWFISPIIAYYISKDMETSLEQLTFEEIQGLRRIARETYAYFDDFLSEKTNWLSPDNYQEEPFNGIAFRTSPTNMAMGLTSNIVAFDFGYISISELIKRMEVILTNMDTLETYKGHFYNWYDIKNKEPLIPKYISTVDSGNLISYIWLVQQSLLEYLKEPVIRSKQIQGLVDILGLTNSDIYTEIISEINAKQLDILSWKDILKKVLDLSSNSKKNSYWDNKANEFAEKLMDELEYLFPWLHNVSHMDKDISCRLIYMCSNITIDKLEFELDSVVDRLQKDDKQLKELLIKSKTRVNLILEKIFNINKRLSQIIVNTDFSILYDKKRDLFSIGYDVEKDSIGNCYYDLLASEARQASFVAIAKGDVPQKHWFKLGRAMTLIGKSKALVSWSGTMFEYLMPLLIMKNYPNTLLYETYKSVVQEQKTYAKERKVPWGISESAFYNFDMNLNYQYKAFGVPGIGLKRGLANELVISPYSSIMALQIDPISACSNIQRLSQEGLEGRYGFYESVDYTKERIPKNKKKGVVKCFMIHHQGMSLLALDNVINNNILQERFHRVPEVKATELLLQERVPKRIIYDRQQKYNFIDICEEKQNIIYRSINTAQTPLPETQLLSNGNYSLMISNSGSGYSKLKDIFLYRWREDATLDSSGMFFYIKDMADLNYWSACYEPCKREAEDYKVIFSSDKAEFTRKDKDIITKTEVTVSNEDNAEVRRISFYNQGKEAKIIEITSYCEVILTSLSDDIAHPAFSNLFIKTERIEEPFCVLADRRPRDKNKKNHWLMQTIAIEGESIGNTQIETSRVNFIGRGRTINRPIIMDSEAPLQNTTGVVIDPIISIRKRIKIKSGETCKIAFSTAIGDSKEELIELAGKYREMSIIDRVFELSYTQAQVEMNYLGIKSSHANLFQQMASRILFFNSKLMGRDSYIKNITKSQTALWTYGISGDNPIVLLIIKKEVDIDFVKQMLSAHEYWSLKGLIVDFVILNNQGTSYLQGLQDSIMNIILSSHAREKRNKFGGVFVLNSNNMCKEDVELFYAIARLLINPENGLLINQIKHCESEISVNDINPKEKEYSYVNDKIEENKLCFFNELGGFDLEKDEYVIKLKDRKTTPAPWINVISNGKFGFQVSESGAGYSWCKNSRENKITPWSNDWVCDGSGEILYLRDEITGDAWTITLNPIRDHGEYIIKHGYGYSSFIHQNQGINAELTMFVPLEDNTKICVLKLKNNCNEIRNLSVTYYARLVMGVIPEKTSQFISTYINKESKYIYAKNPYSENFSNLITFIKIIGGKDDSFTGDRREFIGRGRDNSNPLALDKQCLSNNVGSGLDPCLANQSKFEINIGEEKEIIIILGQQDNIEDIQKTMDKFNSFEKVESELNEVKIYWSNLLKTIKVDTPDKSMNIMLNGWLMYQTIACRIMARAAFYQSGGAFGFRDQLQDVLSLNFIEPDISRNQILYSASRQFVEGDVQHWWHPVVDSGIRTRFSDDLLWLPYLTIDYISKTGDFNILDEMIDYLQEDLLKEGEDERYGIAIKADVQGTLYEHCIKAIDRASKFGSHNIPLMGSGDWNDGMSTIGHKGKGESVWLGWFLYSILDKFEDICIYKQDTERANKYNELKIFIKENLEKYAWDGNWYRRAYFDDGTPLGSIENDECQIDSISQSWAIISQAADTKRASMAMEALEKYLIKEERGMVLLLTPPFCNSILEPGYIKAYVSGVRENGGQYTHSVAWVILALIKQGRGNMASKVFNMINPINHTKSYLECETYKVEPYVMAADVYASEPHVGRGGWSWYTGAAGWMYKVALEGILGLSIHEDKGFTIEPCIPDDWCGFNMEYKRGEALYKIKVERGENKGLTLDGEFIGKKICPFHEKDMHHVLVVI